MLRYVACVAAFLVGAPLWAGELDAEFGGKPAAAKVASPAPNTQPDLVSELDGESPAQAHRRGWGGWGWRGGWGGGWGWRGGWGGGWGGRGRWRWGGGGWGGGGWRGGWGGGRGGGAGWGGGGGGGDGWGGWGWGNGWGGPFVTHSSPVWVSYCW